MVQAEGTLADLMSKPAVIKHPVWNQIFHRVCPVCGTPFSTNRRDKIFCWYVCNETAQRLKAKQKKHEVQS